MLTDTGIAGLWYIVMGLAGIGVVCGLIKLVSDIYDAIWAAPEIRDELVKIRVLLEKQGR
jgi:hypothetical protein